MAERETPVYVGQKAFIEKGDKVLVLRDPNFAGGDRTGLDFPGGRFRWSADPKAELIREVAEETGLEIEVGRPFITWTNWDNQRRDSHRLFFIGYLCKYIAGEVTISAEHNYFEWVDSITYKNWQEDTTHFGVLEEYFKLKKSAGG